MLHHKNKQNFNFVESPKEFNKYTDKKLLRYCLGATMYMPGTKNYLRHIIEKSLPELTSIVWCFEDACPENMVEEAEKNVLTMLDGLNDAISNNEIQQNDMPLLFCRVRNFKQFQRFTSKLTKEQMKLLTGINFPKFNSENGEQYFSYLADLNKKYNELLYGMPIIEDAKVAFKETRIQELLGIRKILDKYYDLVLQVRVGGTDFSSCFGVRRGVDYSIYDILTVKECLSDILNIFTRNNDYVVSGPVWEYFRASKQMMFTDLPKYNIGDCLMKRIPIVNLEIDGLLREVILDKANGFVGRTVIHPTHVKYVNALMAVTKEEYDDAVQILNKDNDGVLKSGQSNKMNEMRPHRNWAEKIYMRSLAFGVIENEHDYFKLFD